MLNALYVESITLDKNDIMKPGAWALSRNDTIQEKVRHDGFAAHALDTCYIE
jgi:hypothetical protein